MLLKESDVKKEKQVLKSKVFFFLNAFGARKKTFEITRIKRVIIVILLLKRLRRKEESKPPLLKVAE